MRRYLFLLVAVSIIVHLSPTGLHAQLLGPTPYLSFNNSPFQSLTFSYFHLENFETGALMVPGVTPSAGSVFGPAGNADSVDADDGVIDGLGRNGHSFFLNSGPTGIRFTFTASALGGNLPTHAGIVWTDGTNNIRFEAFDASNNSLGFLTGSHADGNFLGGTAEDRFYGIINPGGISSILIQSGAGGIEVDHLQYGFVATAVPEPTTIALVGATASGGLACCWRYKRRRPRHRRKTK
jgi:PEP-CTERM motif